MGWFKELLMKLYLIDRPIADRKKQERRKGSRRWEELPKALREPRRRKERRKGKRRG